MLNEVKIKLPLASVFRFQTNVQCNTCQLVGSSTVLLLCQPLLQLLVANYKNNYSSEDFDRPVKIRLKATETIYIQVEYHKVKTDERFDSKAITS